MKKVSIFLIVMMSVLVLSGCSNASNPVVKKSNSDICHQKGSYYYEKTKNFTPFNSVGECLKSGGRLPKR